MNEALKIALILTAVDKASSVFNSSVSKMQGKLASLQKNLNTYGTRIATIGAVGTGAFIGAIKSAADMEKMQVALNTSFQGNKEAAEKAFKSINSFAAKTPYGVSEVMTSFIKLKNMGLDPSENALTAYGNTASSMGKNLNDMIEAVADAATGEFERLKEFGIKASSQGSKVTFTFQGVKTTVGKNAKEIENYLKTVGNTKFAGGIEAQSKTIYGQLSTLKDNFIMAAATAGKVFIPAINAIFQRIAPLIEKIQVFIEKHPILIKWIGMLAVALLAVGTAMKVVSFGIGGIQAAGNAISFLGKILLGSPIILIIAAIAGAAYLIYKNWDKIKEWFANLWQGVKNVFNAAVEGIKFYLINFTPIGLIYKHWDKIKNFFSNIWKGAKSAFNTGVNFIKNILLNFTPVGLIYKYWGPITAWFGKIWDGIKTKFNDAIAWIAGLGSRFLEAGKNIIKSIWEGMKSAWNDLKNWFSEKMEDIRAYLPFSPAKKGALRDIHRIKLFETIAAGAKPAPLLNAVRNATRNTASYLQNPEVNSFVPSRNSGGNNVIHFAPVINLNGSATQADADLLVSRLKKDVLKIVQEQQNRSQRLGFQ